VKLNAITERRWFKPALGAALAVLCGLLLWGTPLGQPWENASYDYLFRFFDRMPATNNVVLIRMDEDSGDRALHARLLDKLTDAKSSLVVFDIFFKTNAGAATDATLADAIRRHGNVVLMAETKRDNNSRYDAVTANLPLTNFLNASAAWGIASVDTQTGGIARHHWPFGISNEPAMHSLAWAAARAYKPDLDLSAQNPWLRYYGANGAWETLSYHIALSNTPAEYFRGKIVFIGHWPKNPGDPAFREDDKFLTPYGEAIGGVAIHATTFLNLINGDWLRRPAALLEFLLLVFAGIVIGGALCQLSRLKSIFIAAAIALAVMLAFVSWSYFTNYWFPWLIIAGGQVPCALAYAWLIGMPKVTSPDERFPGYEIVGKQPFGEGAYGKVWLVRDKIGQLRALKEVERAKFPDEGPYEREFLGIKNYKPVSTQHLGLLHIDHVNRNDAKKYFYYVMELGDALDPDWLGKNAIYHPRDLHNVYSNAPEKKLSVGECVRIGVALAEALDFLHRQKLVHRDIKPSNIIFVGGQPKLADVGLIRETLNCGSSGTLVYTPYYNDPLGLGTELADLYALGVTFYVISTGNHAEKFPNLPTAIVEQPGLMRLNQIICKACHQERAERYASAAEMLAALRLLQHELNSTATEKLSR
jgi:CHASE2 domain-containing sensor protein